MTLTDVAAMGARCSLCPPSKTPRWQQDGVPSIAQIGLLTPHDMPRPGV